MATAADDGGTPGAWMRDSFREVRWRRPFSPAELCELSAALAALGERDHALDPARITRAEFTPGPALEQLIAEITAALRGVGFAVLEGFPTGHHSQAQLRALFWGFVQHIGTPVAQSSRGDLLGDVRDLGTGLTGRQGRGYTSNQALNFHCDAADVTALFWLQSARSGGLTRLASSLAVHDAIAAERPDLLAELYRPLAWSWQGNESPGAPGYYRMPVFGRVDDAIVCAYVRTNILVAHANGGAPPLTDSQRAAVEVFAEVARRPKMYLEAQLGPGALLVTNNHTVLHMRTAFEDWEAPERRRHLLRAWLSPPWSCRLPDGFAEFYRDVRPGALRGGYLPRADTPVYQTA